MQRYCENIYLLQEKVISSNGYIAASLYIDMWKHTHVTALPARIRHTNPIDILALHASAWLGWATWFPLSMCLWHKKGRWNFGIKRYVVQLMRLYLEHNKKLDFKCLCLTWPTPRDNINTKFFDWPMSDKPPPLPSNVDGKCNRSGGQDEGQERSSALEGGGGGGNWGERGHEKFSVNIV